MSTKPTNKVGKPKTEAEKRREREAEALRANLRKRKAATRNQTDVKDLK